MASRRAFLAGSSAAIIASAAPRAAWGRTQVDVAIIGAGLAGLNAARLCENAGLSVTVLEAESALADGCIRWTTCPERPMLAAFRSVPVMRVFMPSPSI